MCIDVTGDKTNGVQAWQADRSSNEDKLLSIVTYFIFLPVVLHNAFKSFKYLMC